MYKFVMEIGPLAVFTSFSDGWLISRQARRLFSASAVLTLLVTVTIFRGVNSSKLPFAERLPLAILGVVGTLALLFIWAGMWRYWYRLDDSGKWVKWLWFLVLLLGFPWSSCVYFLCVYLLQTTRYRVYRVQ